MALQNIAYDLSELVQIAKMKSPFYADLFKEINEKSKNFDISFLPVLEQEQFWQANTWNNNKLLTQKPFDGIVFKSGGTTGAPKFSTYSKREWEVFTSEFGQGMSDNGLNPGDRVGNLFYAGELYASFVFIMKSLEYCKIPVLHFPISGAAKIESIIKTIKDYQINVLVGVPTTLISLAPYLKDLGIEKVFFGGESMYDDQKALLRSFVPNLFINSIGYASVDAGHLGYTTKETLPGEHYVFNSSSIMEIIDEETNQPIKITGVPGKLIYTNLTRTVMPIIRYPVGDRGEWVVPGKIFKLLGRSDEGARVGPVSVTREDVLQALKAINWGDEIGQFQLLVERPHTVDQLTVILAHRDWESKTSADQNEFAHAFLKERVMFDELVQKKLIAPLVVRFVSSEQIIKNERTGKIRFVIDRR